MVLQNEKGREHGRPRMVLSRPLLHPGVGRVVVLVGVVVCAVFVVALCVRFDPAVKRRRRGPAVV